MPVCNIAMFGECLDGFICLSVIIVMFGECLDGFICLSVIIVMFGECLDGFICLSVIFGRSVMITCEAGSQ